MTNPNELLTVLTEGYDTSADPEQVAHYLWLWGWPAAQVGQALTALITANRISDEAEWSGDVLAAIRWAEVHNLSPLTALDGTPTIRPTFRVIAPEDLDVDPADAEADAAAHADMIEQATGVRPEED